MDETVHKKLIDETVKKFGKIDILVGDSDTVTVVMTVTVLFRSIMPVVFPTCKVKNSASQSAWISSTIPSISISKCQ